MKNRYTLALDLWHGLGQERPSRHGPQPESRPIASAFQGPLPGQDCSRPRVHNKWPQKKNNRSSRPDSEPEPKSDSEQGPGPLIIAQTRQEPDKKTRISIERAVESKFKLERNKFQGRFGIPKVDVSRNQQTTSRNIKQNRFRMNYNCLMMTSQ